MKSNKMVQRAYIFFGSNFAGRCLIDAHGFIFFSSTHGFMGGWQQPSQHWRIVKIGAPVLMWSSDSAFNERQDWWEIKAWQQPAWAWTHQKNSPRLGQRVY